MLVFIGHCRPEPIKIQANENGLIEASGFSPIKYWCRVTAPGYLEKAIVQAVEFSAGQTLDLGTITLGKKGWIPYEKVFTCSYIAFDYNTGTNGPWGLRVCQ